MPMNEAAGFKRRSNLTKEQIREAERSLYGLPQQSMNLDNISLEDLKAFVAQREAQAQNKMPKEFDINNPPKTPYFYQEFPKVVYRADGTHVKVHSRREEQEALAAGFGAAPVSVPVAEDPQEHLEAQEQAEISRLDEIARRKKRP